MPVRAKRIQYFDDRLFKTIHDAQSGELPFREPGGGAPQGTLPLSVQAMPMVPRSRSGDESETGVVGADLARSDAEKTLTRADGFPKKTAAVVQTVVAEERRQLEMDFAAQVPATGLEGQPDDEQVRSAVDGLEDLETILKRSL